MEIKIKQMLITAYLHIGVKDPEDLADRVAAALDYLEKDRERYIEVAEPKLPEYLITIKHGVICKIAPLGCLILNSQEKDHLHKHTAVLALMVSDEQVRYVIYHTSARLYDDPMKNTYSYPVYRYIRLEELEESFCVIYPWQITPVATSMEREIYGMIFMAIAKFSKDLSINYIPHKTERAMIAVDCILPTELTLDGRKVTGKLIPIAESRVPEEQQREDHLYKGIKELCLLVTDGTPQYVLKTKHYYDYFRMVVDASVIGGILYEHIGEKTEMTYKGVKLEDIHDPLRPLYN